MRFKTLAMSVLGTMLVGGAAGQPGGAETVTGRCDRACLNALVDQYLAALVARDPSRLPLAQRYKFTENGQTLELGDGLWGSANSLGTYKLTFADPEAGQVGFFGVVEENGHPQILALRLKVEDRLISEIETIVARKQPNAFCEPEGLVDRPIFHQSLAPSERRSRQEMIAIADSYFEGLEQVTGELTPFAPNCTRIENGIVTANNPEGNPMQKLTASEQFETGFSVFITEIRERRYPVVDQERGLVYSLVFFDHAGKVTTVTMTDGTTFTVPPPYDTPFTWMIGELFKIVDGQISRIEAVLVPVPYHMPSGWSQAA